MANDAQGQAAEQRTPSDNELAEAFVAQYERDLRYCHELHQWFRWDGSRWRPDADLTALRLGSKFCAEMAADLRKALDSRKRIDAVLHLARAKLPLATVAAIWDQNPDILCAPGGTVDLRTGELYPANREDFCTRQTRVTPGDDCPLWKAKLAEILPDAAERIFLQRFAGMCATGHVLENKFLYAEGTGRNGKSLLFNMLVWVLGDYAAPIPIEVLLASRFDRHPTELAQLRGRRLVTATEIPHGRSWNESRIKMVTGGDPIAARLMGGNFFHFEATHTLVVFGNEPLKLHSNNPAWEERMLFLRFLQSFVGDRRDKDLPNKLRAEGSGILAWVIEGAVDWYCHGLEPPESVTSAIRSYMAEQDVIGRWLDEDGWRTDDPTAAPRLSVLYAAYKAWCEQTGEYPETENAFSRALNERFPGSKGRDPATRRSIYRGFVQGTDMQQKPFDPSEPSGSAE
jgi:putative DNA primase/helicase